MRSVLTPTRIATLASCLALTAIVTAQSPGPTPLPLPPPIEAPRDVPFRGVVQLRVDATDLDRRLLHVRETIPVEGGAPLVLLYPQWIPGNHSPTGRVDFVAGLKMSSNGARVAWTRDPVNVFAFHVQPPAGATTIDVEFEFASPFDSSEGRVVMTPEIVNVQWNQVVLYPAGYFARQITIEPALQVRSGWHVATALEKRSTDANNVTAFERVSLETLLDSPVFAGRYGNTYDLDPAGPAPFHLNVVADAPEMIAPTGEQLAAHRALVQEAYALFGARHFRHYDFLVALSARLGGIGLEHLESSENALATGYFTDWLRRVDTRNTLPHELAHSWNGKFRRPADLWTPNFNVPMRGSLLWLYEGQTQYWGTVLEARSGLAAREQVIDLLAAIAAGYDHRVGREWRTLQDTTNDPMMALRRPQPWPTWLRREDYYFEGELLWLDVDTLIREKSHGRRSLDDFARAFFGVAPDSTVILTYQFDDVVRALNAVQPHDWAAFLRARLDGHGPGAPLDGLTRGGYRLVYRDTPNDYMRNLDALRNVTTLSYSIGITTVADGRITDVVWNSPAFKAGLTAGQQITAIAGTAFTGARLREAISTAWSTPSPIELLVKSGDSYRTVNLDYHDGLRYPHLDRDTSKPSILDDILAPRRPK